MAVIVPLTFWLLTLCVLATGWFAGDRLDRRAVSQIFFAILATGIVQITVPYHSAMWIILLIDVMLLIAIGRYALTSSRFWPVWFTGLGSAAVFFQVLSLSIPAGFRTAFAVSGAMISGPALLAMMFGILMDRRKSIVNAPATGDLPKRP